jgi:HK97 family phage major capsid protein
LTKIPFSTERAKAFWRGEESAYQATSAKWGTKDIDAHKLTALILISEELLNDSSIANVEAELRTQFSDAFAESEEEAFITGDGVDKPRGFMLDAENGLTTASSTAITPIEIINMYHSLAPKYRKNGTWMFNDDFARILRTMQYADGRFVWQDGLIAGQPDMILKRPVAISEGMADFAAGAKPLAFGDFKRYRIADRTGMYFQRLVELYAGTGQIGLRAYRRMDGKLLVPEAIKTLTVKS